ncbi:hypothetical protein OIO90_000234 [Microbotryomycetes sp. JL221]|nr:hypothetical protein OIO90_000234 [Microbotryomycetes sp. JL221]
MSGPSNRAARATYHPGGYGVSEGLVRARRPFRTSNAITGVVIMGFAVSVYLYSIRAVSQDDFSDVEAPTPQQKLQMTSIEDDRRAKEQAKLDRLGVAALDTGLASQVPEMQDVRGALAQSDNRFAKQLSAGFDSTSSSSTITSQDIAGMTVWERMIGSFGGRGSDSSLIAGAPPVDQLGRVGQSNAAQPQGRRLV